MHQYQPKKINRNQVVVGLMITTMLAACGAPAVKTDSNAPAPIPATTPAQTKADATVNAAKAGQEEITFTDLASCKTETERLQAEYTILQEAFDSGKLTGEAPIKPNLQPDECEAFLAAAEEKYAAEAPTYADQNSCEASGAEECERVDPSPSNNYVQTIYRPVFYGGYSYNPWIAPIYIGGRRNYGSHTTVIYRDSGSSNFSSSGSSRTTTTKPTASTTTKSTTTKSTTSTSPKTTTTKPAATSGSNAITGRGTSGFGSSYKSTGRGGK